MTSPLLKKYCPLDDKCVALLKIAMQRFGLSARAYDRIIKLSRTIADLDHNEKITPQYIAGVPKIIKITSKDLKIY